MHPPLLRALGLKRKLRLGAWIFPILRVLYAARRIRGTRLDPVGYTSVRRVERRLIDEYRAWIDRALEYLELTTVDAVAAVADLPDQVRGYEQIKLRGVETARARAQALIEDLRNTAEARSSMVLHTEAK